MENEINKHIEILYKVFKPYVVLGNLRDRSCDCCVTNNEIKLLLSKKLEELSEDDIGHFMRSAVTTFGDVSDYKHFLPRILELLKSNSDFLDDFLTFEKLNYSEWETWNKNEIDAIDNYFIALFREIINNEKSSYEEIENILSLVVKYSNIKKATEVLENTNSLVVIKYIVDYVLNGKKLEIDFNSETYFKKWLSSKKILKMLENTFLKIKDQEFASRLSITYTILEKDYGNKQ